MIFGRKKSFTPGAVNSAPSASTIVVTVFLPVLPAGVHSAGGIVTIGTKRTLRTARACERHPTYLGVPSRLARYQPVSQAPPGVGTTI
ncbi:hypothetical protein GCM10022243_50800 [Saccharothrix violaceirubra]